MKKFIINISLFVGLIVNLFILPIYAFEFLLIEQKRNPDANSLFAPIIENVVNLILPVDEPTDLDGSFRSAWKKLLLPLDSRHLNLNNNQKLCLTLNSDRIQNLETLIGNEVTFSDGCFEINEAKRIIEIIADL